MDEPRDVVATGVTTQTTMAPAVPTISRVPRKKASQGVPDTTGTKRQKTRSQTTRAIKRSLPEQNTAEDGSGMGNSGNGKTISNAESKQAGRVTSNKKKDQAESYNVM